MKRADAFALVSQHGGKPRQGITKDTRLLIVGELGWPLQDDGRPSNSLTTAKSYGIPIVSERRFLEWVGKSSSEEQTKTYSAAELAALSKLSADVVEQLSMFGLIETRDGLYGFRDLAAARQVAQLLGSGIMLSVITRSLRDIRKWLPDARLSNLRLFPESSDRILVEQVQGRTDLKGQFVLAGYQAGRYRRRRSFRSGASRRGGRRPQRGRKPLPACHETRSERSGGGAQSRQCAAGSATHGGGGSRLSVGRDGGSKLPSGLAQSGRLAR